MIFMKTITTLLQTRATRIQLLRAPEMAMAAARIIGLPVLVSRETLTQIQPA
jgi:hypothetical protein